MRLSLNQIKNLTDQYKWSDDLLSIGVDVLVEKIGAQLGAVEEVIDLGNKYKGIVIVKVMECEKHPNADKLSLCKIDDGGAVKDVPRDEKGYVQVVCGAPNVRSGLQVAWIPPRATVPSTVDKDPFVLESREIRGQASNGMLASPKELALGDSHEGILEIETDASPGSDFAESLGLKDEVIVDIENKMFTHRPDCFGVMGLARELAGIEHKKFTSPEWYMVKPEFPAAKGDKLPLEVINELPDLVPRFTAIAIAGVEIKPSPLWLQIDLIRQGIRPINNIVDLTNYYMTLTGQPLHAYDYDKVKSVGGTDGVSLIVRNPKPGEKLVLLNGKEIEPRPKAMMVASGKKLIGVGGAMGGSETEVDDNSKNIILEAANWDMYEIRRTVMEHGLFTDAATRFTKGQSPLQNLAILSRITTDVLELAGGSVASEAVDVNNVSAAALERNSVHPPVTLTLEFINVRLGSKLTAEEIKGLLENVEFKVELKGENITVTAPFWRTDIELREDVVEEVGRLYGYDLLPLNLPERDLTPAEKGPGLSAKALIRSRLASFGANEVLTYSFVHGDLLKKVGQDKDNAFKVANALRPELQYYRLSLVPSLLEKVHPNIKSGYGSFALFELGKVHSIDQVDDDGLPKEFEFTGFVVAEDDKLKNKGSAYFTAKKFLESLALVGLEYKPIGEDMAKYPVTSPYDRNRSALISIQESGEFLGIIGEFKPSVTRNLKLPRYCAGFEVDTNVLGELLSSPAYYSQLSRFPNVNQDISLRVPNDITYQELFSLVQEGIENKKPDNSIFSLDPLDIYQAENEKGHRNITLRLSIASYERTLTDQEVNSLLDEVSKIAKDKIGAERV